jgi:hypothetical protein
MQEKLIRQKLMISMLSRPSGVSGSGSFREQEKVADQGEHHPSKCFGANRPMLAASKSKSGRNALRAYIKAKVLLDDVLRSLCIYDVASRSFYSLEQGAAFLHAHSYRRRLPEAALEISQKAVRKAAC